MKVQKLISLFAATVATSALCLCAHADTIDTLTLTTTLSSAFSGATNTTVFTVVDGQEGGSTAGPKNLTVAATDVTDPTMTATLRVSSYFLFFSIYQGTALQVEYYGQAIGSYNVQDDGNGFYKLLFNPGSYTLSDPTLVLSTGTLPLDSASLVITQASPTPTPPVPPIAPITVTVTPEPSSLILLSTGLIGLLGSARRRSSTTAHPSCT